MTRETARKLVITLSLTQKELTYLIRKMRVELPEDEASAILRKLERLKLKLN